MEVPFVDRLLSFVDKSDYLQSAESILIFSDFGGEHDGAKFSTFGFLMCDASSLSCFESSSTALRKQYDISVKTEFGYKYLKKDKVMEALPSLLSASNAIKGTLFTVAIDKAIPSLWHQIGGKSSKWELVKQLESAGLGNWKPDIAEKLLLVCHIICGLLTNGTSNARKVLWLSDNDAINENGNKHNFDDTKDVFLHVLEQYSNNVYDLVGFSRSQDSCLYNDLLSLPDFAAGRLQDLLTASFFGIQKGVSSEQLLISNWLGTANHTLDKQSFVYKKSDNKGAAWELSRVDISVVN